MHCNGPAVGHPSDGAPAHGPALPRVSRGHGAPRLDPHTTQRAAPAFPTGILRIFKRFISRSLLNPG